MGLCWVRQLEEALFRHLFWLRCLSMRNKQLGSISSKIPFDMLLLFFARQANVRIINIEILSRNH